MLLGISGSSYDNVGKYYHVVLIWSCLQTLIHIRQGFGQSSCFFIIYLSFFPQYLQSHSFHVLTVPIPDRYVMYYNFLIILDQSLKSQ